MVTDLATLTPIMGHHAHLATQLSEVQGQWSRDEADPAFRLHLARFSRYHLWHAELWTDLLPDSVRLADLVEVSAPDPVWTTTLDGLTEIGTTAQRLAILYRSVVPRLATATRCLRDDFSPVGDAAAARVGGFVAFDLATELADGPFLLHRLTPDDDLVGALELALATDLSLAVSNFGR